MAELDRVISGGQTGADQGGLRAAKAFGIETGGKAPAGFKTENGPEPSLGADYGLTESYSDSYINRTFTNVNDSEGTIRFAVNFGSAGEKCTLNAIHEFKKPHIDVTVDVEWDEPADFDRVVAWIIDFDISVVNIAGHRESVCGGIGLFVETFMTEVFRRLRDRAK